MPGMNDTKVTELFSNNNYIYVANSLTKIQLYSKSYASDVS